MKKVIIITLVLLAALISACTENTNTKRESYPPRVSTFVKSYFGDTELQEVDFRGHLYIIARYGNHLAIIHSENCDCMIDYD